MKIVHLFANETFEPRRFKFVEWSKKENIEVVEILKSKKESYTKFFFKSIIQLLKTKPDLIHAHRISGFIPSIVAKIFRPKTKLIYDKHDVHKYDVVFDKFIFLADYTIVASDIHLKKIRKKTDHCDVIHNYSFFERQNEKIIKKTRKKLGLKSYENR